MLYVAIVAIAALVISLILWISASLAFFSALGYVAFAVTVVVVIDGLTATVARLLPASFAQSDKEVFTVTKKEKLFYEKLKIRKWKDKIPEIGHFTGFRKNKIVDPKSVEYVERFLLEACYGEIGHFASCITGFLTLLFFPITPYWLAISLPVAIINALMNLPSLFILRYNSYKLEILKKNNQKRQTLSRSESA